MISQLLNSPLTYFLYQHFLKFKRYLLPKNMTEQSSLQIIWSVSLATLWDYLATIKLHQLTMEFLNLHLDLALFYTRNKQSHLLFNSQTPIRMSIFENHMCLHRTDKVEFLGQETESLPSLVLQHLEPKMEQEGRQGMDWKPYNLAQLPLKPYLSLGFVFISRENVNYFK